MSLRIMVVSAVALSFAAVTVPAHAVSMSVCSAKYQAFFAAWYFALHAVSMSVCSAKYQAAKKAGTLNGMKWNDFRKAECSASAATTDKDKKSATRKTTATRKSSTSSTSAPRGVVFPTRVSSKFRNESPGKARMHTCLEQYRTNKANNALHGLKWIEKGGGYYSLCNTRLKRG